MVETKRDWIPNFASGSTSVEIINALERVTDLHMMGLTDFQLWLENYRIEASLTRIDLMQIRDQAVFESNIVPSNKKGSRIKIFGLVTDLMDDQRRTTTSS